MVVIIDDDTDDEDEDDGVQFKYLPLYLEWAPMAVFHADKDQEEGAEGPATGETTDGTEVTDASTRTEGTGRTAKVCMLVVDRAFWLTGSLTTWVHTDIVSHFDWFSDNLGPYRYSVPFRLVL